MTESRQTAEINTPELSIPLDTVCFIIAKAREFDVKTGSSDPDADPLDDDDVDAAVLEDRPSDPVRRELMHVIHDLDEDAQLDLVTLMWLGREDGTADDWADLRQTAAQERNARTAQYLLGTPLLSVHLESGLEAIGLDCSDYDETSV